MAKLSGWRKAGLIAGGGCLTILGVLVLGIVIAAVWARARLAEFGDTAPVRTERTIPLANPPASPPDAAGPAVERPPLRLIIDLQEGLFTIRPGAPGNDVQVQGTWAPGLYTLTESREEEPGGVRRATIRFRSTAPAWARFAASVFGGDAAHRPELTVLIPKDTPLDLALSVGMGESRIDLGGLALEQLDLDLAMGEHRIDFTEPVVEAVRRVRLDASMGNVVIANLGNTRAAVIETNGSMGSVTADLGGAWKPAAVSDISFDHSMGELIIRVPASVRFEPSFTTSMGEASNPSAGTPPAADATAPVLRVNVSTSMGNSRVVRY